MTALISDAADGSISPLPPPEEQLLALQQKLWRLTNALLLPASCRPASTTSSPASLLAQIRDCQKDIDSFWASHTSQLTLQAKDAEVASKAEREGLRAGLREGYLAYAMEAFADELDALRQDASFHGSEEDVKGIIAMLEEGLEGLWEGEREGGREEEEALRVYRDSFVTEKDGGESDSKEPVHLRRRRLIQQQQSQEEQQLQQQRHRDEGGATPMEEEEKEKEEEHEKERKRKQEKKRESKKMKKASPNGSKR